MEMCLESKPDILTQKRFHLIRQEKFPPQAGLYLSSMLEEYEFPVSEHFWTPDIVSLLETGADDIWT